MAQPQARHGAALVASMEDEAVAELLSRISELSTLCSVSDKPRDVAKASDSINLLMAHGTLPLPAVLVVCQGAGL
jgi:hypothetical protein